MEVHAHTHTPRKKWTHYFWEFLMLFLAVFCGFLAENQREHMVEHQREKQFMMSLLKDLQSDTSIADYCLKTDTVRIEKIDSLLDILYQPTIEKMDIRKAYYLNKRYLNIFRSLDFNRNTLTQLKNGGNMRLIRKQIVVDTLNWLDTYMMGMDDQKKSVDEAMDFANHLASEIFNTSYFRDAGEFHSAGFILTSAREPQFMTNDIPLIHNYANRVYSMRGTRINYHNQIKYYIELSTQMMQLIQKEYHLQ